MTNTQIPESQCWIPIGLSDCVTRLVSRHPSFDEYDIAELVEERTGIQVTQLDFEAIRAHYHKAKLQAWTPESEDTDE